MRNDQITSGEVQRFAEASLAAGLDADLIRPVAMSFERASELQAQIDQTKERLGVGVEGRLFAGEITCEEAFMLLTAEPVAVKVAGRLKDSVRTKGLARAVAHLRENAQAIFDAATESGQADLAETLKYILSGTGVLPNLRRETVNAEEGSS